MKDLFKMILNFGRKRSTIQDEVPSKHVGSEGAFKAARDFAQKLENEMCFISKTNDLLNAPLVGFDRSKHLKLTLSPKQWLNNGIPLSILFSTETNEPICAYFEDLNVY